jgi:NAD(P)H dehydrogenase (quinone)
MAKVAVVYHSGYGHTKVIAEAVVRGALSVPGTQVDLVPVEEIEKNWTVLEASDAIIFGSPTYMGCVSGPFKMFMDASAKVWFEQKWKDKLAAGFTNSMGLSGDKLNTLQTLAIFAAQQSMIWVGLGEMVDPVGVNRLSSYLGAMTQAGNVPPDQEPGKADQATGEALGRRVAKAAERWRKGA